MNKLLILGTSFGSAAIVQAAQKRGLYTIVTDFLQPEKSLAKQIADEYWMLSTDDIDGLADWCQSDGITAVFAGVSEFNYDKVLALTTRLKLPCYIDPKAWEIARNKRSFKNLCKQYGLATPEDYSLEDFHSDHQHIGFPVVVKPVDLNGNRGVAFCENA